MKLPQFSAARTSLGDPEHGFVLRVEARAGELLDADAWFVEHRDELRACLPRFGAIWFRGFARDSHEFEARIDRLAGDPLTYVGGVTPRSSVHGSVYTATDAPPSLPIVQHHELSYSAQTPRVLAFYCRTPAPSGGCTPLCDGRRVGRALEAHAPTIVDALERRGVLFIRNYNQANFKGWREAWGCSDRATLEATLAAEGLAWDWRGDEWLQTRQRLPGVIRERETGARIVFACVHLWHRWFVAKMCAATGMTLPDDPEQQPYASSFGDGAPIPADFVAAMHAAYERHALAIPYQTHDFVVVHNLLTTHGREAYTPPREVLVTMRERVLSSIEPMFCQPRPGAKDHV